jgi:hypothetical protein
VRVCWKEKASATCVDAGSPQALAPGADGTFSGTLPKELTMGTPRVVNYFVELKNRKGRSAGLSNAGPMIAGAPPEPVEGLTAEVHKAGVVLHWTGGGDASVRLQRKLLSTPAEKPKESMTAPPPEATEQNLLVEDASQGRALDKTARFGETYEYRAQRVARVNVDGKTLEIDGAFSAAVRVDVKDVFPPAVPQGLAAVASLGGNGNGETAIDLSWQPDAETDVAGYVVYRREGDGAWTRISPEKPLIGPAFHDADVQPGHTYRYAVSAVDQGGHESARSDEAQESVPRP